MSAEPLVLPLRMPEKTVLKFKTALFEGEITVVRENGRLTSFEAEEKTDPGTGVFCRMVAALITLCLRSGIPTGKIKACIESVLPNRDDRSLAAHIGRNFVIQAGMSHVEAPEPKRFVSEAL